jgi:DNA-directed RNA polymerase subunit K
MSETLTKYEKARIVGARALQLYHGAPPLIDTEGGIDYIHIAELELERGVMPLFVSR